MSGRKTGVAYLMFSTAAEAQAALALDGVLVMAGGGLLGGAAAEHPAAPFNACCPDRPARILLPLALQDPRCCSAACRWSPVTRRRRVWATSHALRASFPPLGLVPVPMFAGERDEHVCCMPPLRACAQSVFVSCGSCAKAISHDILVHVAPAPATAGPVPMPHTQRSGRGGRFSRSGGRGGRGGRGHGSFKYVRPADEPISHATEPAIAGGDGGNAVAAAAPAGHGGGDRMAE